MRTRVHPDHPTHDAAAYRPTPGRRADVGAPLPAAAAVGPAAVGPATVGPDATRREVAEAKRQARGSAFWQEALALHGSVTPYVVPHVLTAGLVATAVCVVAWAARRWLGLDLRMEVAPHEIAGAVLGLLLVLRTNAGYERWWEARKLWGGIVNQSRNLVIGALAYGPTDPAWRDRVVRWGAAFPHLARASLRGEGPPAEVAALVGPAVAARLAAADHMPNVAAYVLARLLRGAEAGMSPFAFVQVDRERAMLIDHLGGCERILKTPLPRVYAIKIRRFIVLYLLVLPLALLHAVDSTWLVPVITMMVAYPLFSLDQIGVELQNTFSKRNLSHLPLGDITATIERNLVAMADAETVAGEVVAGLVPSDGATATPPSGGVKEHRPSDGGSPPPRRRAAPIPAGAT